MDYDNKNALKWLGFFALGRVVWHRTICIHKELY
jgi:hypothetical protein